MYYAAKIGKAMKALIIAAGKGERLRQFEGDNPKPLFKVAGIPLIERAIITAKKAGITEFVVVTGYQGEKLKNVLSHRQQKLGVRIEFISNPDWEKANGHSVLKAKGFLKEDFILLMSDHIFDYRIIQSFLRSGPGEGEVSLAVDLRIQEVFDLEDATKVKTSNGDILEIGKSLTEYDAIDTGIFYCTTGIFTALEQACVEGKGSLSEAIGILASQGKAKTFRIGNHFWQDVDTPATLKQAEKILFLSVRKETDGFFSRHFNRKVSGFISSLLIKTPLTANQITWSALVIGLLTGFLVSKGTYWDVAVAGLLFQFASIYDGCDGEISKLKFSNSKFGEWLDTICDNITYLAFLVGVILGAHHQGFALAVPFGIMTLFGVGMTLASMYIYLLRYTNSGSLVTVQKELTHDMNATGQGSIRILSKLKFVMKRDFFALFFMVLCLLNRLDVILVLAALGSNITWIVFLLMKREFAVAENELSHDGQI